MVKEVHTEMTPSSTSVNVNIDSSLKKLVEMRQLSRL